MFVVPTGNDERRPPQPGRNNSSNNSSNNNNNNSHRLRIPSHNNSQHVLAVVVDSANRNASDSRRIDSIVNAFSKTSALPIDVWRCKGSGNDDGNNSRCHTPSILLASNYPNCILESDNFCAVSTGFPYHYRGAFGGSESDLVGGSDRPQKSFSRTVLDYCEALVTQEANEESIASEEHLSKEIGRCLKKVSGHFSFFLVRKNNSNTKGLRFWAWNDPFGFMPVYHHSGITGDSSGNSNHTTVLSSHWDCLLPAIASPSTYLQLDLDVVAEYITFGTTLGGKRQIGKRRGDGFDRTFVDGIENLRPGTCLAIETSITKPSNNNNNNDNNNTNKSETMVSLVSTTRPYIACYGACEELLRTKRSKDTTNTLSETTEEAESFATSSEADGFIEPPLHRKRFGRWKGHSSIRVKGVKVAESKNDLVPPFPSFTKDSLPNDSTNHSNDDITRLVSSASLVSEMFEAFSSCIREAMAQGHVSRAALTGGGDTRLILACMLQQQQQQPSKSSPNRNCGNPIPNITFQTHAKQKTDWQIARHLAATFGLKHEKIRPMSTSVEGSLDMPSLLGFRRSEMVPSALHDQIPLRRKQRKKRDRHKEDTLSYTLHGRFGTEFLGCLCFNKSPLDIRTQKELDEFSPKATTWFRAIFRTDLSESREPLRNPINTLQDRFRELQEDQKAFESLRNTNNSNNNNNNNNNNGVESREGALMPILGLDSAYAFQLQLYTRSCLSDIYKGLRGGSWFSIPNAQFTRNQITPFLDNTLLRLLLCSVSVRDKQEPYELYGKLYQHQSSKIPKALVTVPSNNKLLCNHTSIPRAIKAPEAKARPYLPRNAIQQPASATTNRQKAIGCLREAFHPVFWKGAIALFKDAPMAMDVESMANNDQRGDVRALVELVGNAEDACLLSGRLQSFLLWHERRFLVHCD